LLSDGIKVILTLCPLPVGRTDVGFVNVNLPGTDADPPLKTELDSCSILVIDDAVGWDKIVGVVFGARVVVVVVVEVVVAGGAVVVVVVVEEVDVTVICTVQNDIL